MDKEDNGSASLPVLQSTRQEHVANNEQERSLILRETECHDLYCQRLQTEKMASVLLTPTIISQEYIPEVQENSVTPNLKECLNESTPTLMSESSSYSDSSPPIAVTELSSIATLAGPEGMEVVQANCHNSNSVESQVSSTRRTVAQSTTDVSRTADQVLGSDEPRPLDGNGDAVANSALQSVVHGVDKLSDQRPHENGTAFFIVEAADQVLGSDEPRPLDGNDGAVANSAVQSVVHDVDKLPDQQPHENGMAFSMVEIGETITTAESVEQACGSDEASDSDTTDSSDSTSSSDETTSDESCDLKIRHKDIELSEEIAALKSAEPPKVKGEILPIELPPVEDLNILLPDEEALEPVGKITHIMADHSVVVQSYAGKPALDFETVLFLSRQMAMGKVEETFGPVPSPFYIVRFNSVEHLESKGIELDKEVFYTPHIKDFTSFVFVAALRQIRGSDASWCNDREPPPSCCDYSDDEQEREARRKRKNQGTENRSGEDTTSESSTGASDGRKGGTANNRGRGRGRDRWHNESRKYVMQMPDPAQMMWQSAVNDRLTRPRHGQLIENLQAEGTTGWRRERHPPNPQAFRGPYGRMPPPPTPDLLACFQRPPMDVPGHYGPPAAQFSGQFPPPVRWNVPPPLFQPPMFRFGPPPPPPPL